MTKKTKKIALTEVLKIGDKTHKTIDLRKPNSGELRKLSLVMILQMQVETMHDLLPRITTPMLSREILEEMDIGDFSALCGETVDFFTGD